LIDKEEIIKLAKHNGIKNYQQERHYLQTLILLELSKYNMVFKGGTYLWFCHNLPRYSEDLDFTSQGELNKDMPDKIINFLKSFDLEANVKNIINDQRTLSFKITITGPLFNGNPRSKCQIDVEISKRENIIVTPLPFDIYFTYYSLQSKIIKGMNLNEVFAEKVRAIMTRKKGRDIFDLYFLIKYKNIVPDYDLINKKLDYYGEKFDDTKFIAQLKLEDGPYNLDLTNLVFIKLPEFKEVYKTIIEAFK